MTTFKTLLVDDEYLALNLLETFIQEIPELEIVDKVKSPVKALEILTQTRIDLLFLDIQMPTLSGNNLLRTLPRPPVTIFTTAYADFAVEAFNLNVADYLLKPFSFERFLQAVNKAKERLRENPVPPTVAPLPLAGVEENRDFFSVKVDGKVVKVHYEDILFIEGLKEYVRIVCRDARYVTLESLKNLEELLPQSNFVRVHKSYIVAKDKVQALDGNLLEIQKHKIPISRTKRDEVVQEVFYK
ncbi:MAG: LytTR family DNA-binding domain-containing protein [Saprospiraceae bacterium]|nr:LytTR family DNA-binding domain-containing protein [Saprospiraceae bacterium]MDZ4704778.1 LytTR family DNA-binding domain-containing protein [Saprospiraceae bacterium]